MTSYLYRMCVCVCRAGTRCVRYPFATCLVLTQSRATRARVIRKTQTIMPAICEVGGGGLFLPLHDSEQLMPLPLRAIAYSCALSLILLASFRLAKILLAALAVVTDRTYSSDRERVPQRENTAIIGVFVIACGIQIPTTLLGVIELVSNNYYAQGLGPSSVVDAGAFGMLAIGAASVLAVPAGQTREVASPAVAMLLVGMSATAYVFLAFILLVTSPGAIEVWEAVVTVALLPAVGLGIARASAAHPVGGAYALHESVRTEEDNGSRPPPQTELDTTSKRAWQGAWWSCCSGGLSCVVPPVRRCGGWPAAATCLMYSGFLAALAGDLSAMLGCVLGLHEALMALYVGIPCGVASQLFCAVHAARHSAHADLALAIIAGLNISAVFCCRWCPLAGRRCALGGRRAHRRVGRGIPSRRRLSGGADSAGRCHWLLRRRLLRVRAGCRRRSRLSAAGVGRGRRARWHTLRCLRHCILSVCRVGSVCLRGDAESFTRGRAFEIVKCAAPRFEDPPRP